MLISQACYISLLVTYKKSDRLTFWFTCRVLPAMSINLCLDPFTGTTVSVEQVREADGSPTRDQNGNLVFVGPGMDNYVVAKLLLSHYYSGFSPLYYC